MARGATRYTISRVLTVVVKTLQESMEYTPHDHSVHGTLTALARAMWADYEEDFDHWYEMTEGVYQHRRRHGGPPYLYGITVSCRLCGASIYFETWNPLDPDPVPSAATPEHLFRLLASHLVASGHRVFVERAIATDLFVVPTIGRFARCYRMFPHGWKRWIRRQPPLESIGAMRWKTQHPSRRIRLRNVILAPKWFLDLMASSYSDQVCRHVVKRAVEDGKFRTALEGVSALPTNANGLSSFIEAQFAG